MPSVSQLDSPPSSPKSPPRKRAKFSLKLKSKKKTSDGEKSEKREKLFPIFSPASGQDPCDEAFDPPKPPLPHAGLKNHGNICYASAVLQVLRYCPGFAACVEGIASDESSLQQSHVEENDRAGEMGVNGDVCEELDKDDNQSAAVVCRLKELLCQMEVLEEDYIANKENCDHLLQWRNSLLLAARPLDFMESFRKQNPMFESNLQHDAQEFLCSLLVNIQDAENDIKKKMKEVGELISEKPEVKNHQMVETPTSKLTSNDSGKNEYRSRFEELFQGRLLHQTKCMTCEHAKRCFEDFQDISVPIQKEATIYDPKKAKAFSPTPKKKGHESNSLCWALSQFATVEHLTGDNKYFCDNCLTHTEAEIMTCFDKLPRIFTIHLKRFTANSLSGFQAAYVSKITSNLETPMELSIKEWCSKTCAHPNPRYQLFGIVMHSGMTSCSGHYQAYVKVPTCSAADINNNDSKQPFNNHQCSAGNEASYLSENCDAEKECADVQSTKELQSHNCPDINVPVVSKSFSCNTFSSGNGSSECDQKSPVDVSPQRVSQSPDSSAEKAKTTCISGITKYFHKSRKDSTKGNKAQKNGTVTKKGYSTQEDETQKNQNTQISCFAEDDQSLKKIQSFRYHGSSAVRMLKFQDGASGSVSSTAKDFPEGTKGHTGVEEASNPCRDLSTMQTFQWVHFDDAEVQILEESDLTTLLSSSDSAFTSPYLLFYKLVEP